MNDNILIYLLSVDLNGQLRNMLAFKQQQLQKKPGDIQLTAYIRKITHDIREITSVVNRAGEQCIDFVSKNYGCKFQFMVPDNMKDKPKGVDGKEIKLN